MHTQGKRRIDRTHYHKDFPALDVWRSKTILVGELGKKQAQATEQPSKCTNCMKHKAE